MLKFSKLFNYSLSNGEAFSEQIAVPESERAFLVRCKNKIREHLRPAIAQASVTVLGMDKQVIPRFRTQGSWSYKTCVFPANQPPQEVDWDFGVYLPVSVWEDNGSPKVMAKAYFTLVETLLRQLCEKEKWTLDPSKNTCIRVQVSTWAHINVPLYAASEDEFKLIVEMRASTIVAKSMVFDSARAFAEDSNEGDLVGQEWDDMDGIFLAQRSGDWKESDSNKISKWYKDRVEEQGEQLLRVCRYVKAWRDFQWVTGGPSSVSLMIAVAQRFEAVLGRDDLALEQASKLLSIALAGPIREKGIDDEDEDFNRLNPAERVEAALRAAQLAKCIEHSRGTSIALSNTVIPNLRGILGVRIPNRVEWVELDLADSVRQTPAAKVVAPTVGTSRAG